MRVAIIGAGISGLACAYELEKNGIMPVIYEKGSHIGNPAGYAGISIKAMTKGFKDPLRSLDQKYGLDIKPISMLEEINMISPQKKKTIRGDLGFIFKRGYEAYSVENQIAAWVKTPITFDTFIKLEDIINEYDHIIVATSTPSIGKQLDVWNETFLGFARIAIVLGKFKTSSSTIWFNEAFANKAFAYLIPNSSKEATLTLITNYCSNAEMDYYWNEFLNIERIKYQIVQMSDLEHNCGFVNPYKVGKVYFVGNAAGFTDDLVGIGATNAILSGILAADSIIKGCDYNHLVKPIFRDIQKFHECRKAVNTFDNQSFDKMVMFLGTPFIKQFIYKNPLMRIQYASFLAKFYNKL